MAVFLSTEAEQKWLDLALKSNPENLRIKLYVDDHVDDLTDTPADFTEASGFGYADKVLTASSWTISAGGPSVADYAQQTWTFSGAAGLIYGYYLVGNTSTKLYAAERFENGPYNVTTTGDTVRVSPRITLSREIP